MPGGVSVDGLSWAPKKAVFVRRSLIVGGVTFALLALLGTGVSLYFDAPIFWVFPTALALTLGFIFDDILRWRAVKYDRWQISDGHLIHEGQDGSARIPLTEIDRALRRLGSNVVVQLTSGQQIVLRYLPYPAETAAQINAAKPV
ncbi:hypothetical protein C1J02_03335 [Sulfitobacter sp. SK011]|nr:hypothetical protein C1J02_03335 [Sulfitobacter sp. SK011]